MYALVDANSFYCFCEIAFNPQLQGRAVVVLSNNDGCVVSLTPDAKQLGITRGAPYFEIKELLQQHGGRAFSSNYALYGSQSAKLMGYLAAHAPQVEIYSIDECFLDLRGMQRWVAPDLNAYAQQLRAGALKRMHVPTCVGIAPTKTLAKVANRIAKKHPDLQGVLCLESAAQRQWALEQLPAADVWGIGPRYAQLLAGQGITTAAQLAACPESWARKFLGGVVGARLVRELQGYSCLDMAPSEDGSLVRQSICYSRSFGRPLRAQADVAAAVAAFTSRAAEKLRRQRDAARILAIFLSRSRYDQSPPPHTRSVVLSLPVATSDTLSLVRYAQQALQQLWQPGTAYTKAGVILDAMEPAGQQQLHLFAEPPKVHQNSRLMERLDQLNARFGSGTVQVATATTASGQERLWQARASLRSPAYTTRFEDLLVVGSQ